MSVSRRLAIVLLATTLLGCRDDLTGPTAFGIDGGHHNVVVVLRNTEGVASLKRAEILLDGVALENQILTTKGAEVTISGTTTRIERGLHVGSIRVLEQSTSPSRYALVRLEVSYTYHENGKWFSPRSLGYPLSTVATLATGESVNFNVSW